MMLETSPNAQLSPVDQFGGAPPGQWNNPYPVRSDYPETTAIVPCRGPRYNSTVGPLASFVGPSKSFSGAQNPSAHDPPPSSKPTIGNLECLRKHVGARQPFAGATPPPPPTGKLQDVAYETQAAASWEIENPAPLMGSIPARVIQPIPFSAVGAIK